MLYVRFQNLFILKLKKLYPLTNNLPIPPPPPPQAKARSSVQGWAEDSYTESETLGKGPGS